MNSNDGEKPRRNRGPRRPRDGAQTRDERGHGGGFKGRGGEHSQRSRGPAKRPYRSRDEQRQPDAAQSGSGPRRALSHQQPVMGGTERTGEPELAERLAQALEAPAGAPDDALTHGFHTYPARMHYAIARAALASFLPERGEVLDPFCGSGTVLTEARLAGHAAFGVDLNPLARRVAEVQCTPLSEERCEQLLSAVEAVATASEERVRARVKTHAQLPKSEVAFYDPHILLELAGLFEEIQAVEDDLLRRTLTVVFSAQVVKFSQQRSETSGEVQQRRLRKGLPTEFFVRKSQELVQRYAALREATHSDPQPVRIMEGDARKLHRVLRKGTQVDLVLSSPPYGGTYDYVDHHARRYPWLGLSTERFSAGEIGARRHLSDDSGMRRWDQELSAVLSSMARVCKPGASVVLLMGDAQIGRERIDAAAQVAALAKPAGLTMLASAAQFRPDFQGGPPRREHLMALRVEQAQALSPDA